MLLFSFLRNKYLWIVAWVLQSIGYHSVLKRIGDNPDFSIVPFFAEWRLSKYVFSRNVTFFMPLIITMVLNRLEASTKPVVFLDGFPRTVPQAKAMMESGIIPTMVVEFLLDESIILERLENRVVCTSCNTSYNLVGDKRPKVEGICDKCGGVVARRKDDAKEVALNRFDVYLKQTHPCLGVFASSNIPVHTIDNGDSENAQKQFEELMATL